MFCFLRQDFSVALEAVLELTLVDQAGLELRDPPASASRVCHHRPAILKVLHGDILTIITPNLFITK